MVPAATAAVPAAARFLHTVSAALVGDRGVRVAAAAVASAVAVPTVAASPRAVAVVIGNNSGLAAPCLAVAMIVGAAAVCAANINHCHYLKN